MCQDEGRGIVDNRLAEDFAHPHLRRVDAALVELDQVEHPIAGVQVHHPQFFMVEWSHEGQQDVVGVLRALDGGAFGGVSIELPR